MQSYRCTCCIEHTYIYSTDIYEAEANDHMVLLYIDQTAYHRIEDTRSQVKYTRHQFIRSLIKLIYKYHLKKVKQMFRIYL